MSEPATRTTEALPWSLPNEFRATLPAVDFGYSNTACFAIVGAIPEECVATVIVITDDLGATLQKLKDDRKPAAHDRVFTKDGKPWVCWEEAFNGAVNRAGLKNFRFHDLTPLLRFVVSNEKCPRDKGRWNSWATKTRG
jgi:hypothetical protein